MLRKHRSKSKPQNYGGRGSTRFPGIVADARALGVSRITLWRMLAGKPGFELPSLRRRYDLLKEAEAA
jgi:hypothetical protein